MVVGSKFDVFANENESMQKKNLCLAMRHIAHQYGCDLVFASVKEKLPGQLYRALVSHFVFEGGPLGKVEKSHLQPVHVPAACDSFSSIGEPDGAQNRK